MIRLSRAAFAAVAVGSFCASSVLASEGQLTIFANGEELDTDGFTAPELTSDGWGLKFDHIYVTLSDITALQTDPPYDPESGEGPATQVAVEVGAGKPVTIYLPDADDEGRVKVGSAT